MKNQAGSIREQFSSSAAGAPSFRMFARQRGFASNGFQFAVLPTF
jgi:hypothetical protein